MRRPARGGPSGLPLLGFFLCGRLLWLLGRFLFLRNGFLRRLLLRGFFLFLFRLGLSLGLLRSGFGLPGRRLFLRLSFEFEIDELEDGDFGGVAAARSELDDAGVAARTIGEARPEGFEE